MKWPDVYQFAGPIGPTHVWFAWHPVRLWWGKLVWLKFVKRARVASLSSLPGPQTVKWTYEETGQ